VKRIIPYSLSDIEKKMLKIIATHSIHNINSIELAYRNCGKSFDKLRTALKISGSYLIDLIEISKEIK